MIIETKFELDGSVPTLFRLCDGDHWAIVVRLADRGDMTERYVRTKVPACVRAIVVDRLPYGVRGALLHMRRRILDADSGVPVSVSVSARELSDALGMSEEDAKTAMSAVSRMQHGDDPGAPGDGPWLEWEGKEDSEAWSARIHPDLLCGFVWPISDDVPQDEQKSGKEHAVNNREKYRTMNNREKYRTSVPAQTDFTERQEDAIGEFYNDLASFLEAHLHRDSPLHPFDVYDLDEDKFIERLADEISQECADHGIYLRFPEHVTYPDGFERFSDHPYPDDAAEAGEFVKKINGKKGE